MKLNNIIVILIVGALGYAGGRYLTPAKIVEVEKKVENTVTETKTVIVEVEKPDGSKTKTTTIDQSKTKTKEATNETNTTPKSDGITASVIAGMDVTKPGTFLYGAHVTKPFIGPIVLGVFGMTNGVVGASIGLKF